MPVIAFAALDSRASRTHRDECAPPASAPATVRCINPALHAALPCTTLHYATMLCTSLHYTALERAS